MTITGFAGTSLQPNSGAQGEYSGLWSYEHIMNQGRRT